MAEVPVDYDPFAAKTSSSKGKEVSVDYDPFAETPAYAQFPAAFNVGIAPIVEPVERFVGMNRQLAAGKFPSYSESETPISNWLRSARPPQTPTQRVMRRAGEVFTENLPYTVLAMTGAPAVAAVEKSVSPTRLGALKNVAIETAQGIRNAPATAALGEALSTFTSGLGVGTAREYLGEKYEPLGGLVGGFAPIASTYAPSGLAVRGTKWLYSRFSPQALAEKAKETVSNVIGPSFSIEAREGLKEAERLRKQIPGYQPSLAEATGSPSLTVTQRAIEQSAEGQQLENFAARRRANESAISAYAAKNAPEGFNPEYVIDTANNKLTGLYGQIEAAKQKTASITGGLSTIFPSARRDLGSQGKAVRDRYNELRVTTRTEMDKLAEDLKLNDLNLTEPFQTYVSDVDKLIKSRSYLASEKGVPETAKKLMAFKSSGDKEEIIPTNFTDIMALRTTISDDLRTATSGTNPNPGQARLLKVMETKLDKWLESAVASKSPEIKANYDAFRATYKKEYIDRFNQGSAFKVRQRDGRGFYQTPDEKVAELFAKDETSAKQFKQTFGENAPEVKNVNDILLDDLRNSAVKEGDINQKALSQWREKNASILKEFPVTDLTTKNLETAMRSIGERNAVLEGRKKSIEDSILARNLQAVNRGTLTPDETIDRSLKSPKLMQQIVERVRDDEEAFNSLRRAVWDRVSVLPPAQIKDALKTPSVISVLNLQQRNSISDIASASEQLARVQASSGQPYDPNILADIEARLGTGINQLMSRVFAVQSGRVGAKSAGVDLLGRFMRGQSKTQMGELLNKAMYDPEIAKDLADYIKFPGTRQIKAKRINSWLLTNGYLPEEKEKPPEVPNY